MSIQSGIPKGAAVAINDLLDNCAKIQPDQEVVLLAHVDGLYGGDNFVDQKPSLGFSPLYNCVVPIQQFSG